MKIESSKIRLSKYAIFICVSFGFFSSCKEDSFRCDKAGEIVHSVEMGEGYFFYNEDLNAYLIRYHVPGSIDSFWTGLLCAGEFLESDAPSTVIFTGDFRDDSGTINPTEVIGGEEFYYLDLVGLEKGE